MNYFLQTHCLLSRLSQRTEAVGLTCIVLLSAILITSQPFIRNWSYRLFFISHVVLGIVLLPSLLFHGSHLRVYILEALVIFMIDIGVRRLDTTIGHSTIVRIPHTNLLKLTVPLSEREMRRYKSAPGQHTYISIPHLGHSARSSKLSIHALQKKILSNPVSVAHVSENEITLILRERQGPASRALTALVQTNKAHPPICVEGPYGASRFFPNFATSYDNILLVAGGVGGAFMMPVYNDICRNMTLENKNSPKLRFIWAVRSAKEVAWIADLPEFQDVLHDPQMKLHVTGIGSGMSVTDSDSVCEDVDLVHIHHDDNSSQGVERNRPNLRRIVNDIIGQNDTKKTAVVVCGPRGMAEELRGHIAHWVKKGKEVWWHNESFGW